MKIVFVPCAQEQLLELEQIATDHGSSVKFFSTMSPRLSFYILFCLLLRLRRPRRRRTKITYMIMHETL